MLKLTAPYSYGKIYVVDDDTSVDVHVYVDIFGIEHYGKIEVHTKEGTQEFDYNKMPEELYVYTA